MIYVNEEDLRIDGNVDLKALTVEIPVKSSTKEERKKPYVLRKRGYIRVHYNNEMYVLLFPRGYRWDGASIPFGFRWLIGAKGSPEFLFPSMVHDRLCENKDFIGRNRYLSSLIFKKLLIYCGVSEFKAGTMFHAVDNFQKFCGW